MGSIFAQSQRALGIGKWTATAYHDLGTIYTEPASSSQGQRTYMYVQFVKTANVDGHQGTPVGWSANMGDAAFIVHGDESTAVQDIFIGVVQNSSAAAVTTAYYGWIQLAKTGEVLQSAVMASGGSAAEFVCWNADTGLARTDSPLSATAFAVFGYPPIGFICSPTPTVSASTAPAGGDSLISLYQWAHVMVIGAGGPAA
ncbi:MAG TPA: hypothetical protein VM243_12905 [Phycisphaerae bacterium]|nr:hypothetical protein [Phycisphaerae bacterium]